MSVFTEGGWHKVGGGIRWGVGGVELGELAFA